MPKGKQCRRRRLRRRSRIDDTATTDINALPDDLLQQVLLHVSSWPVYLFRAAATCKRWRRVIVGFHTCQDVLVGHYFAAVEPPAEERTAGIRCCFEPWPPRPQAANIRQRLSLGFLPGGGPPYNWRAVTDSRRGLLAVVQDNHCVVVCDPWTQQYRTVNLMDWTLPGNDDAAGDYNICFLGAFLVDSDETGLELSNFTVLCVRLVRDYHADTLTAQARVISASDNGWLWYYDINTDIGNDVIWGGVGHLDMHKDFLGREGGSIFWSLDFNVVLAVDETTGQFSTLTLPRNQTSRCDRPRTT
ncbi:hypothetical protein QOZ80_4BG0348850 [Eleusine coracana subsp. coracana]|nr:hypothetical protein QOZ80_4BG0348850 [Eleusine coracana subsp. coracana]